MIFNIYFLRILNFLLVTFFPFSNFPA